MKERYMSFLVLCINSSFSSTLEHQASEQSKAQPEEGASDVCILSGHRLPSLVHERARHLLQRGNSARTENSAHLLGESCGVSELDTDLELSDHERQIVRILSTFLVTQMVSNLKMRGVADTFHDDL